MNTPVPEGHVCGLMGEHVARDVGTEPCPGTALPEDPCANESDDQSRPEQIRAESGYQSTQAQRRDCSLVVGGR